MPTYKELLESPEWQERRVEILTRDRFRCQQCFNEKVLDELKIGLLEHKHVHTRQLLIYLPDGTTTSGWCNREMHDAIRENNIIAFTQEEQFINIVGRRGLKPDEMEVYVTIPNRKRQEYAERLVAQYYNSGSQPGECPDTKPTHFINILPVNISKWRLFKGLHVHHHYYQDGAYPWEYNDDALITLCIHCHHALHKEKKVPRKDANGKDYATLTPCTRCDGAGWFEQYHHVEQGICFECRGAKYRELIGKPFNKL